MEYANLEQRILNAYLAMFPEFVPAQSAEVSISEQKDFYDLMKRLYQLLFHDPSLVVPTLHEDDAFPSRYKKGYGKPELETNVLKIKNAVEKLLQTMFRIGQGSDLKPNKRQMKILSALGIEDLKKLPTAWVWMSNRPGAAQAAFTYCLFREDYVYSVDVYARLLGEEVFRRLERWMISHGYKPYDITSENGKLTLAYANPAWGSEPPRGGNEYKIMHTGICAQYDAYVGNPTALGLCIPYGMKNFLENFDSMNQKVKDFVIERTKKCDGCRYCVQTDKTGTRPLACMPISYKQSEYKLCPYFPGYNYAWTSIDDKLVDNLIEMLAFMDTFADRTVQRKKEA